MTTPLLKIDDLRVEFATRRGILVAVDGVSFEVNPGEVFGLVGESGAGKSLTGQAIIGLLEPPGYIANGEIILEGKRIDNLPYQGMRALRGKKIGHDLPGPAYQPESALHGGQAAGGNHPDPPASFRVPGQAKSAIDLLNEVGIPAAKRRIDNYPHQFSGGMRQRVVIALALCANPSLIIADEPTTALDVSIQAQIIALLRKLCKEHGTAVILITHDMGVIAEISDRVAVMYAGRLVEVGKAYNVVKKPNAPLLPGPHGFHPVAAPAHRKAEADRDGSMPRLTDIPDGCAFHLRCPQAFELCRQKRPEIMDTDTSQAACWLYRKGGAR